MRCILVLLFVSLILMGGCATLQNDTAMANVRQMGKDIQQAAKDGNAVGFLLVESQDMGGEIVNAFRLKSPVRATAVILYDYRGAQNDGATD